MKLNTLANHIYIYVLVQKDVLETSSRYDARVSILHGMLRESGRTCQETCIRLNIGIRKITKHGPLASSELFIFQTKEETWKICKPSEL